MIFTAIVLVAQAVTTFLVLRAVNRRTAQSVQRFNEATEFHEKGMAAYEEAKQFHAAGVAFHEAALTAFAHRVRAETAERWLS